MVVPWVFWLCVGVLVVLVLVDGCFDLSEW